MEWVDGLFRVLALLICHNVCYFKLVRLLVFVTIVSVECVIVKNHKSHIGH